MRLLPIILAALTMAAVPATATADPAGYRVVQIRREAAPFAINNYGDLVSSYDNEGSLESYIFPAPYRRRIALVGLDHRSAVVTAQSDLRGLAGYYVGFASDGFPVFGVTWDRAGHPTALPGYTGLPAGQNPLVRPAGINDHGQLVGTAYRPGYGEVATRWSSTHAASPIDATGSNVKVTAINNDAVAAGSVGGHAALFLPGDSVFNLQRAPGEAASIVLAVNDADEAVGISSHDGVGAPVFWDSLGHVHGIVRPAGSTSARVTSINADGAFVGTVVTRLGREGVVWSSPTHPVVLPNPTLDPQRQTSWLATGINDAGEVTGWWYYRINGLPSAVVWAPSR